MSNRLIEHNQNIGAENAQAAIEKAAVGIGGKKRKSQYSVALYLAAMFTVVLLLMALSYFIGQRNHTIISGNIPEGYSALADEALEMEDNNHA